MAQNPYFWHPWNLKTMVFIFSLSFYIFLYVFNILYIFYILPWVFWPLCQNTRKNSIKFEPQETPWKPQEAPRRPQKGPGGHRRPQKAIGGPQEAQGTPEGSRRPPGSHQRGTGSSGVWNGHFAIRFQVQISEIWPWVVFRRKWVLFNYMSIRKSMKFDSE